MTTSVLTRPIPSTGELLPVVGVGSWQKFDVNPSGRPLIREVLDTMLTSGGTLIDSSPMYGRAEDVIGRVTKEMPERNRFFYATKVWMTGQNAGRMQMEDSCFNMRRKVMDLIQVHNLVDVHTHLHTLDKWKQDGKVRYTGITHYTVESHPLLEEMIKTRKVDFVQFNYSIGVRNAERSLLRTAQDHGVAVIVNEPLEKGAVFERMRGQMLPGWALEIGITSWAQFFLKYIISHPAVTCVIPATADPAHMKDNVEAAKGALPDEKMRIKMVELYESLG